MSYISKLNIILPVLGSVFIGIRDEVASWLGIVMILRWGQDQGWQISCKIIHTEHSSIDQGSFYIDVTANCKNKVH